MLKKVAVVYYNGLVNWASPIIIKSHCSIDVTNFPFDDQLCEMKFGPWQYSGNEVVINGSGKSIGLDEACIPFYLSLSISV